MPCCPRSAIRIFRNNSGFFYPTVKHSLCIDCGICIKICPYLGVNTVTLSKNQSADVHYSSLLGQYVDSWVGYSTDFNIRRLASSGGVITALLVFMFQRKIIDGAVVVAMDAENPLQAKAIIATSEKEAISAIGSKYTPVSMHDVVREILSNPDNKYALVGLPCHLKAIANAEKIYPTLASSLVVKLGLYCNNTPSVEAIQFVLAQLRVSPEEVVQLRFRDQGWPGCLSIKLKNGIEIKLPMTEYWRSGFGEFFCRTQCILCTDQTAEFSDISFADPWTLDTWTYNIKPNRSLGKSLVLVRTLEGANLLGAASNEHYISLMPIDPAKAIQYATILKKTAKNSPSVKLLLRRKHTPFQTCYPLQINVDALRWLLLFRVNSLLAKNKKTWRLLSFSVLVSSNILSLLSFVKQSFKNIR